MLLGVWGGLLAGGELLGSSWRSGELGGTARRLGLWEIPRGLCWLFSLSRPLGQVQPLPGYRHHLPMPGPLLAAKGMDLVLPAQGQQAAVVGCWQLPKI